MSRRSNTASSRQSGRESSREPDRAPRKGERAREDARREAHTPIVEWVLGALGALFLICSVVFLVDQGLEGADRPGEVALTAGEVSSVGEQFLVRFTARNSGTQTLAGLHVTARVLRGEEEIDRSQTVLDYLPARSSREGGFYLREDPREHRLELRVEGYQDP